MLEEHGVQVHVPEQGVVLSMVASGELDGIKAAVEQLGSEFPHSGSVIIEGEDRDRGAENGRATALPRDLVEEARTANRARPPDAAQRPDDAALPQDATPRPGVAAQPPDAAQRPDDVPNPLDAAQRPHNAAPSQQIAQRPHDAAPSHETAQRPDDVPKPGDVSRRPDDADTDEFPAIPGQLAEERPVAGSAQSQASPRRCSASTAKGRQCRLPAKPGDATCAVHGLRALSAADCARPLHPVFSPP